jgi:hypothetical protein
LLLRRYGGSGNKTGFYCTDSATIGSITVNKFDLLMTDQDRGTNGDGGGLFGFALGSYALPGGQANNMTSTWRQLSTAAGLAGGASNRYGLWLSNNRSLLQAYSDYGGMQACPVHVAAYHAAAAVKAMQ